MTQTLRNTVFEAIDSELDYAAKWDKIETSDKDRIKDKDKTAGDWLVYIRGYYNQLVNNVTFDYNLDFDTSDTWRKIGGLCVNCMVHCGVVPRKGYLDPNDPKDMGDHIFGMSDRDRAYFAITDERNYQDNLPKDRHSGRQHRSDGGYVVMFGHYLREAEKAWTLNAGDKAAMEVVRKLAGIAVHCMEDHGVRKRK